MPNRRLFAYFVVLVTVFSEFRCCLPVTKLLLERGADANAANEEGRTSLHKAAARRRADICHLLLQHGASTNRRDIKGNTPLFVTLERGDASDVMEVLLTSPDLDLRARNRKTFSVLHFACFTGRTRCAEMIVRRDPTLVHERMESEGWLPIHVAATNNQTETLHMLVQAGSSVNCRSDDSITPLQLASARGWVELIQTLVELGADINAQDKDRMTPLHRALWFAESSMDDSEERKVQSAKYLILHGARTELLNKRGETAFQMTQPHVREQMELFLKEQSNQAKKTPVLQKPTAPFTSTEFGNVPPSTSAASEKKGSAASSTSCMKCSQAEACVVFLPCADKVACIKCAHAYSTCPKCSTTIAVRIDTDGKKLSSPP